MKITKQLNNNIIIASDSQGHESILMGKGIGFGCRPGMEPDMNLVEKQFLGLSSSTHMKQLTELLDRIPLEYFLLGIKIAEYVQENFQKPLNETLILMISDHISFAIERHIKNLDLTNALLLEIRKFYPHEYQLGLNALDIIKCETGYQLREDEAGFLAMHIVNAQYGSSDPLAQDLIQFIQDILNLVRYTYSIDLDEDSLVYIRFVTHLKFFLARVFTKETYKDNEDLYGIISMMYPKAAACVQKISTYLYHKLGCTLDLEEKGYLILHIEKLTRTN